MKFTAFDHYENTGSRPDFPEIPCLTPPLQKNLDTIIRKRSFNKLNLHLPEKGTA